MSFSIKILCPLFLGTIVFFTSAKKCSKTPPNPAIESSAKDFSWLNYYMESFNKERGFSGAVLIAKGEDLVFQKAIGWADVEKDLANDLHTRFNLGSGNKMFTAIAIAQLVERGKLKYDDPISKYLTDYPNIRFANRATIHDLLTHTSGLGDYWDDEYEKHWGNLKTLKDRIPFVVKDSLLFEPGERHSYSNSGFIVLGLIIEEISGESYFDFIKKNIYLPAGMTKSDSYKNNGTVPDLAIGYQGLNNQWYVARHGLMGTSAGGGFSTLGDMFRFDKALRNNILLSKESVDLLRSDKTPAAENRSWEYGYGFIVNQVNGKLRVGHGGRGPGIYFEYYFFPELDYTMIIFSNSESGAPDALFRKINDFITTPETDQLAVSAETEKNTVQESFNVEIIPHPDKSEMITYLDAEANEDLSPYWNNITTLATAINEQRIEAFNDCFAKKDLVTLASNESMFNFMVKQVIPSRGKIEKFHALSDPVKVTDSPFLIRVATFHLEDGYPGSISISLNEEGKVDHISLFVHPQICSNGKDVDCPEVARHLKK